MTLQVPFFFTVEPLFHQDFFFSFGQSTLIIEKGISPLKQQGYLLNIKKEYLKITMLIILFSKFKKKEDSHTWKTLLTFPLFSCYKDIKSDLLWKYAF